MITPAVSLVPEPDTQLRQLTEAISDRWPEAPPYGGRFAEIVPHLTIAQGRKMPSWRGSRPTSPAPPEVRRGPGSCTTSRLEVDGLAQAIGVEWARRCCWTSAWTPDGQEFVTSH
ncbi:2'-5' RNA ligase family protein [Streptomyces sp. NPDC050534]|uniref:2'-5' RNA ligase family protein n=1 Tax=Streptomyces sp. NPDC050534 TaxID=3365625 RepID=UPI0037982507